MLIRSDIPAEEPAFQVQVDTLLPASSTWRMLTRRGQARKLPKGLDAWWDAAIGRVQARLPRRNRYLHRAKRILKLQDRLENVAASRLRERAQEFRHLFRCGRERRHHLNQAYALISEVIFRQLEIRLHQVQIAAALAMDGGCIAELATGEGKTLAATLPATIAGWRGRGCHVITVNDYLANRDAEEMRPIYRFCNLRVAHVDGQMSGPDRQRAYDADVTYCTNKEVTADYLRDRLTLGSLRGLPAALLGKMATGAEHGLGRLTLRGLECAIIDEVDSVLIDEAVTPLIISGDMPNTEQLEAYRQAAKLVHHMEKRKDYRIDQRFHDVNLTNRGRLKLADLAEDLGGLWRGVRRREELIRQAITARDIYQRDKQYVVQDDKIVIVDEFTGRLMPDRTWRDGLHQAMEAKEELAINPIKGTQARISFQRFFRLYRKLAGMTGTAIENRQEMWVLFHLPVVAMPTHRPVIRKRASDRLFARANAKWQAVVEEIHRVHAEGRPILVGTRSVGASEKLAQRLEESGLPHRVLNAVRHAEEAQIVAEAGHVGRITVATNMAGRGTDIKPDREVCDLGGMHVIATERHEAGRIDRQLFGRTGRQGDPGTATAYLSLEDELFRRYGARWVMALLQLRITGTSATADFLTAFLINWVQKRAECRAFRQRKEVLKSDDWLEEHLGFAGKEL